MTESSIEIGAMSNRGKLLALVAGPILGLLTYFLLKLHEGCFRDCR